MRAPRPPSPIIVVDTNIILSVALGRRSRPAFEIIRARRELVTSVRSVEEALGVLHDLKGVRETMTAQTEAILRDLAIVEAAAYAKSLPEATHVLSHAVAFRNGSTSDAHFLACAWLLDADIWSHDRDFAGTGWPSWSNANLLRSLDAS
ncbi:PIN domain-containing protein [Methylobacterium sp. 17Sr1-1]|uniref:PIN domain-containing protein n=1 Tax=Methylobacterium sp. 17Sr1-1 TaxID=2202826 RepID=UPI0013A587E2|nr:PIN domain-containing protein [Methylobacterium sp. 17Sr1-1]